MSLNKPGGARFGIHSIDHFALEVPDLALARHFIGTFGLRIRDTETGFDLYADGSEHRWARIAHGPRKRMAYLSLNCYAEELDGLREQAFAAGALLTDDGRHISGEGFWIYDPDGNLLQVRAGVKTTPYAKLDKPPRQVGPGVRGATGRQGRARVSPGRLSHVLLFTPDIERAMRFYERALGLHLSDRSGNLVAFMHGRHGSDHHLVAFAGSTAKGWHHSSWDVPGIEEVGMGSEQMRDAGYREGWGLGRHSLGSNYFYYARDPWGSFWEYSAHMDFVPAGFAWPGGDHEAGDSLHVWGPELPPEMIENTEA